MIKTTAFLGALFATSLAFGADVGGLKGLAKDVGNELSATAKGSASDAITKKLKKVQNEKGPIRFVKGKADVDPACDKTMQAIAGILTEFPGFHVQVDGHTDNVGKPEANQRLSQERAEAVVRYLVEKKGAEGKRLSAKGWGDSKPIASNDSEKGRAKNRRVDFTITAMQ